MRADKLLALVTTWPAALDVARAITSAEYRQERGWDLGDWTCRREPWGMYFIHHNAEHVPVEVIAVVSGDGVDSDTTAAVPGVSLPTRWARPAPAAESAPPPTSETVPSNKKPSKRRPVWMGLAVLGLGLAALTGLVVFSLQPTATTPPSAGEPQRYLYCPQCRLEMTCAPGQEARETFCPHCGKAWIMEVNTFSRRKGESPPLSASKKQVLWAVGLGLPVALAAAALAVAVYWSGREPTPENAVVVFACPACGHKLRSQILAPGSTAVCPVCGEHFLVRAARSAGNRGSAKAPERRTKTGSKLTSKVSGERPRGE
jgi:predicted RNA-binding Zn-ribbon protein involved in translation (DUF1610 family)